MMSTIKNVTRKNEKGKSYRYLISIVRFTDEAINKFDENNITFLD
jgi:hypothetical protein